MKYCNRCVIPDTKPGIELDSVGLCSACRNQLNKKFIDWNERWDELLELCNTYKRNDGGYDCIVTVSGGKDSYYQLHILKNILRMNPLTVTVNSVFCETKTGRKNFRNMLDVFSVDNISLNLNRDIARKMTREYFEDYGYGAYPMDLAIYVFPLKLANKLGIPLIFYGENVSYEYGGVLKDETPSAKKQIENTVANPIDLKYWEDKGIFKKDLNPFMITKKEIKNIDPQYLSYYVKWDGWKNYQIAKKYGFQHCKDEWHREGYIEDYDQIDTIGYLVNAWLKYPKFGFARTTDVCCYWINSGLIDRETAVELVKRHDHILDQRMLNDWLKFTGYTHEEFWEIVDTHYNNDIFEYVDGKWVLKNEIR